LKINIVFYVCTVLWSWPGLGMSIFCQNSQLLQVVGCFALGLPVVWRSAKPLLKDTALSFAKGKTGLDCFVSLAWSGRV
jgi:hypothetical protein